MTERLTKAGTEALAIMLAALACLFCVWRIDPQPGTVVLAVVLCVSLGRSHIDRDLRGRIEAAFVLPAVTLACVGVGWLLRTVPAAGAAAYVLGMGLSIWIRRFGLRARRAGGLIALPFVTLLAVPVHLAPGGFTVALGGAAIHFPSLMLPIFSGWLALLWVGLAHLALKRLTPRRGRDASPVAAEAAGTAKAAAPASTAQAIAAAAPDESPAPLVKRLLPSTRMALQMGVALALAFVIGDLAFREHWAWIVLTAMIVNLGNRGRLDVLYKGIQRLGGAAAGTVFAFIVAYAMSTMLPSSAHAEAHVAAALFALFLGVWLRPFGYAWWALCITVTLALLQGLAPLASLSLLGTRLIAIAVGSVIGVGSAWWVFPVDSSVVLRRRLADALASLSDAFDPDHPGRAERGKAEYSGRFHIALKGLAEVAPVFLAARQLMRWTIRHPVPGASGIRGAAIHYLHALSLDADRIDTLNGCEEAACDLITIGAMPPDVRRAVGTSRKTLRDREENLRALQALGGQLDRAVQRSRSDGNRN